MSDQSQMDRDAADLERFGYKQELKRGLGTFCSFAVAFSYISPSTGYFTLFSSGSRLSAHTCSGPGPWWRCSSSSSRSTSPRSPSHFPLAGSVFQWTKFLAGRGYA